MQRKATGRTPCPPVATFNHTSQKAVITMNWYIRIDSDKGPAHMLEVDTSQPDTGNMRPRKFYSRAEARTVAMEHRKKYPAYRYTVFKAPPGFHSCEWTFDDGAIYFGFTNSTYWNGFLNVWVSVGVRDEIVAELRRGGEDDEETLAHERPDRNGLISLAYGYATSEVAY